MKAVTALVALALLATTHALYKSYYRGMGGGMMGPYSTGMSMYPGMYGGSGMMGGNYGSYPYYGGGMSGYAGGMSGYPTGMGGYSGGMMGGMYGPYEGMAGYPGGMGGYPGSIGGYPGAAGGYPGGMGAYPGGMGGYPGGNYGTWGQRCTCRKYCMPWERYAGKCWGCFKKWCRVRCCRWW